MIRYIEKKLGVKVNDDPLIVQLNFEPSGRPLSERNYYLQEKENLCVVCGSTDSYIRKNIVPHEYRKFFPSVMKDHKSHDVVLMCTTCHQLSGNYDTHVRRELAKKCSAPLDDNINGKFTKDTVLARVKSAAKALLYCKDKIPADRRTELENVVRSYYNTGELSVDLLKEAAVLDFHVPSSGYVAHGELVVRWMMENDGLLELEKIWRKNFLRSMQPKHMPKLWSVDHSHERLQTISTDNSQQKL